MSIRCLKTLLVVWITVLCAYGADAFVKRELIFENAPFLSCHGATLTQAPDGRLLCAWFAGTGEKKSDTGIWLSQLTDGTWSRPLEFANGLQASGRRFASWNPVLFTFKDGRIFLAYRIGDSPRDWYGFYRISKDNGESWGMAIAFPETAMGPVRNPPVELDSGRVVVPSSTEFHSTFGWRLEFDISDDNGRTWRAVVPEDSGWINAIQPALMVQNTGRLQAMARSRSGQLATTFSDDGGLTWTPVALTNVDNPNAGIGAVALKDGRFLLVHNVGERRNRIAVSISSDGVNWKHALWLQNDDNINHEYSYPTVIQTKDGKIHVVYTWRRENIAHEVIDPSNL